MWVRCQGQEDALAEEMATHSNILAWEIPWKGEPGELQSIGSQRVRHNFKTTKHQFYFELFKKLPYCSP